MTQYFAAYFTAMNSWKSCEVVELGIYRTEQAAMWAGLQNARQHPDRDPHVAQSLKWTRIPSGLVAKASFGRYDIRVVAAG